MALPINIEDLLRKQKIEGIRIEFKAGWNPDSIYHSICAFANDFDNIGGGYILVGVEEENGIAKRPVKGLPTNEIDGILKDMVGFNNKINPYYMPRTSVEKVDGQNILVIWAPSGVNRPYDVWESVVSKNNPKTEWYIRSGSSSIVAKGEVLDELREMANRTPFDDRGNPDISVDDISPMLVLDYLKKVDSKLVTDFHKVPIEDILDKMDLFTGPTERRMLKNVAAMMFCENPAKFFPYTQVEIVLFPNGLEQDPSNMIEIPKISGPVPYMIKATLDYLKTNLIKERIIKPKDKAESEKFFNYPYQAFEEAVVNALYHRDYQEREPVEIRIEPQGVAILSYAGPDRSISMEAIQKAKLLKARRYRNRRLGDFLKELDLSEGRATGIPTIQDELRKNGSLPARIETDDARSYFLIEIPCREGFKSTIEPIEKESELKSKLKSKHKDELKGELKTLRIILDLMIENPEITTMALVEKSGKSRSTVQKSIRILRNEYCIDRVGGKKYGRWIVLM
ncbi:MAG: transcriptional regulator [Rikenellaceae bacterium]|nr:transcriptional regulator [Rikenellaceae bacterium]